MFSKFFRILTLILVLSLVLAMPAAVAEGSEEAVPEEAGQTEESALPPLPDIDINSWEFIVANTYNSILYYSAPVVGFEKQGIDHRIAENLRAMLSDARKSYNVYIVSAYRNFEFQLAHFESFLTTQESSAEAIKKKHAPGTCDHQTGLGVCLSNDPSICAAYYFYDNSAVLESDLYDWLLEHCHEYGFILRYPEGKEAYYGTPCEPGHFRYVGVEAATYIMENDLCLEEFVLLYDEDAIVLPDIDE